MRLALGTVQFGLDYGIANAQGQVAPAEVASILALARQMGISTLDTAINYGQSESVLGQCGIAEWQVVTKLPALPEAMGDVAGWVQTHMRQSLARLGVASVHAVLLHRPQDLLGAQGRALLSGLKDLQLQGLAAKMGISVYSPEELEVFFDLHRFDIVQAPFSILDQRLQTSGWLSKLHAMGVEVHTRSAFLQGLLLMDAAHRPAKFERWQHVWQCWENWLASQGMTALQACLRYPLSEPAIDKVVIGVDSAMHLQQILDAAIGTMPPPPNWPLPLDLELLLPSLWN
jgi:aryl-alcohol dehydrogenase-like predicted oxidoreductase